MSSRSRVPPQRRALEPLALAPALRIPAFAAAALSLEKFIPKS
ncbi:MAG: hypothetical protein QXU52_01405 [Fervidicoccaceae archaeon]